VWLFYNSQIFADPTISKGPGWPTGAFDYTVGNAVAGNIKKAIISFSSGNSATTTLVYMASVSFSVVTSSPMLELITANVVAVSVTAGSVFQSATGTQIVAGTGYVQINGGTVPQWRRLLFASEALQQEPNQRRLLQQGSPVPFVTGDCNGDGLFNANDATYAQERVTMGVSSWPLGSVAQMRNCAPTFSYMFNNLLSSYSANDIQITIADVAYLLHASTNRVFFLNISSPNDLVTEVPQANGQSWNAVATYYYFPSSTAVADFSEAPCASSSGYFEMNVASVTHSASIGSVYGSTSEGVVFQGTCASGTFSASITCDLQSVLNMSVGFINNGTGNVYAFFGRLRESQ